MKTHILRTPLRTLIVGVALTFLTGAPALAQSRAQWLDPTDWFDPQRATNLKSDDSSSVYDLGYDYGLGENFDYAIWSTYGKWGSDVGPRSYNAGYWDKRTWSSSSDDLSSPSGKTAEFSIYPASTSRRTRGSSESVRQDAKSDDTDRDNRSGRNTASNRGDRSNRSDRGNDGSSGTAGRQSDGSDRVAHLVGTVQGLSNIQLRRDSGATGTYTLAKVQLENGRETIANLGREDQVKPLDLEEGAKIEAVGRRGTIDNESVFVAHRLKAATVTIDANPTIRLADESLDRKTETHTGTIGRVRESSDSESTTTLVELKLDNGKSAWLDLGPAASLKKIGLDTGERVTVRGSLREKDDARDVITASLLKVGEGTQSTASSEE